MDVNYGDDFVRLKVLIDNNTLIDSYYYGEPALCFYIETDNEKTLFDTGYSKSFTKNASLMNIDIDNINNIIISHGHNDHTNGLKYYLDKEVNKKVKLYAHPLTFNDKKIDKENIGSLYNIKDIDKYFSLITSKIPINVTDNLIFLGEIPQINDFEKRISIGELKINDGYVTDYLYDDTALVYKSDKGLLIVTGCSHSGICNIIEYAKKVCNSEKIYGVICGFHLTNDKVVIEKTINYFKENNIENIYPCHCTSLYAKSMFIKEFSDLVKEVGVGFEINI